MSLSLGGKLKIRSMVYVAGENIPFFWPMRSFIHHNPLHGLEHLPFQAAVQKGAGLFSGQVFLPRESYQRYLAQNRIDRNDLAAAVAEFAPVGQQIEDIDLRSMLMTLLIELPTSAVLPALAASPEDVRLALSGKEPAGEVHLTSQQLTDYLQSRLTGDCPVYEAVDALYGTHIGNNLDELVIKGCLDFFDEGQSVWGMPGRERGLFSAWREVARRNVKLSLQGLHIDEVLGIDDSPEGVIAHAMETLRIPEEHWVGYFARELVRLHGWAGFVRWRSSAMHYYWAERFPADVTDYLAVRLTLALALLSESGRRGLPSTAEAIGQVIQSRPCEAFLRHELYTRSVLPTLAHRVDDAVSRGDARTIERVCREYLGQQRRQEAQTQANRLLDLAQRAGQKSTLLDLSAHSLGALVETLREFETQEGMVWLRAMEVHAMDQLLSGVDLSEAAPREKRPFAQALFCIDTRSERIRRHLEGIGDYQTFGIAGFFGVPVSFIELGKGSENHLCPVLLTPKNVVLEVTAVGPQEEPALSALEKAMHDLKESVLTPFVTVEAIGLLFGFDMIGKTVAPHSYNRWRKRLHPQKPPTRLLTDKLSREQADSIVRAVQRAVIVKAVEQEFSLAPEKITDDLVRALREAALGNEAISGVVAESLGVDGSRAAGFVERLRSAYRINDSFAQMQMERLGRIGFTVDEQALLVSQALRAVGLGEGLSRFVLLVGHGSTSENNPYESALDCGACGGNHGLVSARVLAQMANKPEVRKRLAKHGIDVAEDAWFVPALHNTTTDEVKLYDLDLLPPSHLVYLDRLRGGLKAASRLCAQERLRTLQVEPLMRDDPAAAERSAQRNALDWSQVRPEWGLSGNAYFVVGRRNLTQRLTLDGRAFLHSYDYRLDPKQRLLENILAGPLVVGQWINMEHYFSTVDNERFGSGSKVYHNVAGRFGVMTGNLSDLRTGLPAQTVLDNGMPYHQPLRLITVIEAPFEHARHALEAVQSVKRLLRNGWIRVMVIDPQTWEVRVYDEGEWRVRVAAAADIHVQSEESVVS